MCSHRFTVVAVCTLALASRAQFPCGTEEQRQIVGSVNTLSSWSLDLCGERLIVGTRGAAVHEAAFVHEREAGGPGLWARVATLQGSDALDGEQYGNEVAVDGDRAVVGAHDHFHNLVKSGAAYVFERDASGIWSEVAELLSAAPLENQQFGFDVALSGDWILVSAAGPGGLGTAEFFHRDQLGTWRFHSAKPHQAWSVALDGADAILGRANATAFVFRYDQPGDFWLQVGAIPQPQQSNNNWGTEVALSEGMALFGSRNAFPHGPGSGTAQLFARDQGGPGNWGLVKELLPTLPQAGLEFGTAVALQGDTAVVTCPREFMASVGAEAGAAYVFRRDEGGPGQWGLVAKLRASDAAEGARLGDSAAVDGRTLAVGDLDFGAAEGAAYVFVEQPRGANVYCSAGTSARGCRAFVCAGDLASASAPAGFVVYAAGIQGSNSGTFFYSTGARAALPWGNGTSVQCMTAPYVRAGLQSSVGVSGACQGRLQLDLNQLWTAKPAKNPGAGAVTRLQLWYRDPASTSNRATSLSDAVEFTLAP